jgi:hypothetical protein
MKEPSFFISRRADAYRDIDLVMKHASSRLIDGEYWRKYHNGYITIRKRIPNLSSHVEMLVYSPIEVYKGTRLLAIAGMIPNALAATTERVVEAFGTIEHPTAIKRLRAIRGLEGTTFLYDDKVEVVWSS